MKILLSVNGLKNYKIHKEFVLLATENMNPFSHMFLQWTIHHRYQEWNKDFTIQ